MPVRSSRHKDRGKEDGRVPCSISHKTASEQPWKLIICPFQEEAKELLGVERI